MHVTFFLRYIDIKYNYYPLISHHTLTSYALITTSYAFRIVIATDNLLRKEAKIK